MQPAQISYGAKHSHSYLHILPILHCQVDLSCLVSTIRWYHEMENGTEVLIKVIIITVTHMIILLCRIWRIFSDSNVTPRTKGLRYFLLCCANFLNATEKLWYALPVLCSIYLPQSPHLHTNKLYQHQNISTVIALKCFR